MPRLLRQRGLALWGLSFVVEARAGWVEPTHTLQTILRWLRELAAAARDEGIHPYVNDQFEAFVDVPDLPDGVVRFFDPDAIVRLDPLGSVRRGREMLETWHETRCRWWNPRSANAAEVSGFGEHIV